MKSPQPVDLITLCEVPEERSYDFVPQSFNDYVGQRDLKDKLAIYTKAAMMRGEALDHLLLFGPPGLGKTTLANIMAQVLGVGIKLCTGPMIERTGDLVAILSSLESRDILFIDEIHRLASNIEEVLYSAMEQFRVDVIIGQGAGAKSVSIPVHPFTLIGATTKSGMLSAPLRSRFGIIERLDYYADEDLATIVQQAAQFMQLSLDNESAIMIARRARGTPRIAKKIVRRVRDFSQVAEKQHADVELVQQALNFLGIDDDGLTSIDIKLLHSLLDQFNGGPAGLETLACLVGEDAQTIEEVYEPYLLRKGYLEKTSRGRQIPHKRLIWLREKFGGQSSLWE